MFNEIINVANSTSTVSISFDNKIVRYNMNYYILHTVLLVIILIFLIAFICFHYANRSKQKHFGVLPI